MRLIDADALRFESCLLEDGIVYVPFRDINKAPTIGTEPRRHGHWKIFTMCSVCKHDLREYSKEAAIDFPFCPMCGAKMDDLSWISSGKENN